MAEMDIYHTQKAEDFATLAKEHLDGEIEFYEQVSPKVPKSPTRPTRDSVTVTPLFRVIHHSHFPFFLKERERERIENVQRRSSSVYAQRVASSSRRYTRIWRPAARASRPSTSGTSSIRA